MEICKDEEPRLEPVAGVREHLQACYLDDAVKRREAVRLLTATEANALS
jgi:hypothetical protein